MKPFKALLILSIGMMVSTVSASPTPEKKQDTHFVLNNVAPIEITSLQVLELNSEALVLVSINAINAPLIFESFEYHSSKSIGDVGWCDLNYKQDTRNKNKFHFVAIKTYDYSFKSTVSVKEIPFREKLFENYNLEIKDKNSHQFRIRNDC